MYYWHCSSCGVGVVGGGGPSESDGLEFSGRFWERRVT